jgi:hypothetical protein
MMQDDAFALNRNASLSVRQVGHGETPVITIDDFAEDTAMLVENACTQASYGPDPTSRYPGLRARLPRYYVREVLKTLFPMLFRVYGVPGSLAMKPVNAVYSLVATPEEDLEPGQCAPHFDSANPWYLAVLHYLNPGPFCDTGLFRHRATGLERVSEQTLGSYLEVREMEKARLGAAKPSYIKGSNDQFELHDRIEYRANRLVVYPGSLLHSGLVNPDVDIDPDPRTGRLTANLFVDFFATPARP